MPDLRSVSDDKFAPPYARSLAVNMHVRTSRAISHAWSGVELRGATLGVAYTWRRRVNAPLVLPEDGSLAPATRNFHTGGTLPVCVLHTVKRGTRR